MSSATNTRRFAARLMCGLLLAACDGGPWEPVPSHLEIDGGDDQWALVGSTLSQALAVRVLDRHDRPVPGATVTWTVEEGGGTVSPWPSVTNDRGVAATWFAVGPDEGIHTVSAAVGGSVSTRPVTFRARAVTAVVSVTVPDASDAYNCFYYGVCTPEEFAPADVVVAVGRTVAWDWDGSGPCNLVFEDDPTEPTSSATKTSGTHFRTFTAPGTYRYRCTQRSTSFTEGMVGTVRVR